MSPISFWMALAFALLGILMHVNGCPSDERSYLLDFKGGLIQLGDRLSSWQGFNCCDWKGIQCDSHSGHVITVDIKNPEFDWVFSYVPYLSGYIHPSLFNLQHLQYLDLGYNYFKKIPISPQFGKLNRLTFLSLSNSGFRGEIPVELGNITTLRHLDLSARDKVYVFQSRRFLESRKFAAWIKNLRSLEYLSMGGVNLTMASEHWGDALSSLSNLTHLDLSDCGLSGTIPSLVNLTLLSHLHLRSNPFLSPMPAWFQNVSSLVSLDLSGCGLHGSIPSNFLHRSSMNIINLSGNRELTGDLSFIRNHSSSLTVLSLGYTSVGGVIPTSIVHFQKLQKLDLAWSYLTGDIPQFGSELGAFPSLSVIDVSGNSLNGSIPLSFGRLSSLTNLRLDNNQLTGSVSLSMFQYLTHLQELDLSGNHLTVNISSNWIPQFDQLLYLLLGSCNIQGDFPAFFSTQYSLRNLDLSNNQIEGNVPNWLWVL